jgi:hypothetical protein
MSKIGLIIICVLQLVGCGGPKGSDITDAPKESSNPEEVITATPFAEEGTDEPENTPPVKEENNDHIPFITHKYDVVILCSGLSGMGLFADNVVSVVDPEDGDLPFLNAWGVEGPQSEETIYKWRHPEDNPEIVQDRGPFYTTMAYGDEDSDGTRPVGTTAYDSEGHVAYKEYKIKYSSDDDSACIGIVTVNVEGLRVRNKPSSDGEEIGHAWQNAKYYYFEQTDSDGHIWYRIGDDMWIADGDGWLTIEFVD